MRSLLFVSLIAALLAFGGGANANQIKDTYTTPGFLKKWEWSVVSSDVRRSGATAAEMKIFSANMLALRELLKASPVAGQPVGYNTILPGYFEEFDVPERPDLDPRDFPLRALIWFGAFSQEFDDNGKLLPTIGETTLMAFRANMLPQWQEKPALWRELSTDVSLQPRYHKEDVAGLPQYGDLLVLKRNNRPLWVPVNMDESLKLVLAQRKKKIAEWETKAAEVRKNYADHIDPARRAERQANYKLAAQVQKDPAAFMTKMEQVDKASEEILRKQAQDAAPDAGWTWWADAIAQLKEAETDFASLSAAQKAAPACYIDHSPDRKPDTRPFTSLVPVNTPGCRPVIRPNWSYFDPALPRTAIQLITIWVRECPQADPPADGDPAGCSANMALLRSMDWEKVKAIMDR